MQPASQYSTIHTASQPANYSTMLPAFELQLQTMQPESQQNSFFQSLFFKKHYSVTETVEA
jgi:hypothetical protein